MPTALALASNHIITENDTELKGKPLWTNEELGELDRYNFSIKNLMDNFPDKYMYLHPVKLSKWK